MSSRPADFDYQRYLASREWALLKNQVRERSRGQCERCLFGSYKQTHHLTYERIGHEDLDDIQAVCKDCHEFLSGLSDRDPAAEFVLMPAIRFASYRHEGKGEWYGIIETVADSRNKFELKVGEQADGLVAVFAALTAPEKIWHPFLISGEIYDAFCDERFVDDKGRPPFIKSIKTCFFPCTGGDCMSCVAAQRRGL